MEFKVSFDTYAKIVITLVTILFAGIISFHIAQMIEHPGRLAAGLSGMDCNVVDLSRRYFCDGSDVV